MIRIYNTLNCKSKKIDGKKVIVYTCGITVYDYCHIGHARVFIFFDALVRYLTFLKMPVTFVRNITDIDDKIIRKAFKSGKSINSISNIFIDKMHVDNKCLNLIEPTFEPRATNFLNNIIYLISFLKKRKKIYKGVDNDIYYDIVKNINYGCLSNVVLSKSKLGDKNFKFFNKKFDLDFTLWKSDENFWVSPWGIGRPGWHSECAAMILYYSKEFITIHGGGKDLLFPHHENELAQISILRGLDFVKIWMHVGHVKIGGKKMSKSFNNHLLIKNVLMRFNEEYLRFFLMFTHYRFAVNYSLSAMCKAKKSLDNLYKVISKLKGKYSIDQGLKIKFFNALNQDFNTPMAISILFEIAAKIKGNYFSNENQKLIFTLKFLGVQIGLFKYEAKKFLFSTTLVTKVRKKIRFLLMKRNLARKEKKWVIADKIRLQLKKFGVKITDRKV